MVFLNPACQQLHFHILSLQHFEMIFHWDHLFQLSIFHFDSILMVDRLQLNRNNYPGIALAFLLLRR